MAEAFCHLSLMIYPNTFQVSLSSVALAMEEGLLRHLRAGRSVKFASPSSHQVLRQVSSATTWADIAKAKRLLGWSPQVTPEEGFKRTVDWHMASRSWLKEIRP